MKTLVNFRDLGGLVAANGAKIKANVLLRSGEPVGMSKEDIELLSETYRLRKIIDFRSASEVNEKPVDKVPGASHLNLDVLSDTMGHVPNLEEILKNLNLEKADEFMFDVYEKLITNKTAQKGYRQFIEALLENTDGALLFHCQAGKDRTGLASLIILKILGASDEDIMTDYLATIEGRKVVNENMIEDLRTAGFPESELKAFGVMMSVKPDYLQRAIDKINNIYGSFENYLAKTLNVTDEEITTLQELYLEK